MTRTLLPALSGRYPPLSPAEREREEHFVRRMLAASIIAGLAGAILFLVFPLLDIAIIRWLTPSGTGQRFPLSGSEAWSFIRRALMWGFFLYYVATIIAAIRAWQLATPVLGLPAVRWIYLIACSVAGPLLFTNVWLKDNVGRPRPRSVEEFGGPHDFVPVFHPGGACRDNCSFVSGEVSSMAMIFASLAFAVPAWRKPLLVAFLLGWGLASWIRIGMGAHFPSDSYLAGVFMMAIAAILYRLLVLDLKPLASRSHGLPRAGRPGVWRRSGQRSISRFEAVMDPLADRALALLDRVFPRR